MPPVVEDVLDVAINLDFRCVLGPDDFQRGRSIAKIAPEVFAVQRLSASKSGKNASRHRLYSLFRGDVSRDRVHADKCLSGHFGAWRRDAEVLLNADRQLERVDRVQG